MTLLYTDDIFRQHDTGEHPECIARLESIDQRLHEQQLYDHVTSAPTVSADDQDLLRVHTPAYLQQLRESAAAGGGRVEADTQMSTHSADAAWQAAGSVVDAVERVTTGADRQALCLTRPPGHHALSDAPMGFCLLSNVAIAAKTAVQRLGLDRVLIVDWDVHHGNGTQDAVYDDEQITFLSIHRSPFYPGTGARSETGSGRGLGSNFNVPLEIGITRQDYFSAFESALTTAADHCRPQLILISAGFDAHRDDPIGSLGLETEDFARLTTLVGQVAAVHADGRLVSTLEGGYHLERLADSVALHLTTLLQAEL